MSTLTSSIPVDAAPVEPRVTAGRPASAWQLLVRRPGSLVCLIIVGVYLLLALLTLVPAFAMRATAVVGTDYMAPSFHQFPDLLLGTDIQGRSVFFRTLYGCRTALVIALSTSVLSLGIGVTLGIVAGYFGRWIDELVTWLVATVSAVPWILLVLTLSFVLKGVTLGFLGSLGRQPDGTPVGIPDLAIVILALGLTDWVGICRLIRAEVLKQRTLDYVAAARALGLSQPRILFRHILPNCLHIVIITFTLGAVGYVQAEVALTFLGLGITDKPSWGRMVDDAKLELLRGVWWQFAAATIAIGVLSLALSLLGDALRDVLDPKLRTRR